MKTLIITIGLTLMSSVLFAQSKEEAMEKTSWLKFGADVGVPVGKASNYSSFVAGLELKGQLMEAEHVGLGLTAGYENYFAKSGFRNVGIVPLGGFVRLYPERTGFFAGLDAGYGIITVANAGGGLFLKPQLGYHNYNWNVFAYYDNVFRNTSDGGGIGNVGLGATYNIRFK